MTARLHDAGFVHQDFHPGNILVRLGRRRPPALAMIDLDALRVSRRLSWPDAAAEPRAPEPLLLAPLATGPTATGSCSRTSTPARPRPPDPKAFARGIEDVDPRLGRAALEALGAAVPEVEQVFPEVPGRARLGGRLARPRPAARSAPCWPTPTRRSAGPGRVDPQGLADDDRGRDDDDRPGPAGAR